MVDFLAKKTSSLDELALNMGCPNELAHELIIIFPIQITEHGGIPVYPSCTDTHVLSGFVYFDQDSCSERS
jgi:hypothetical protein